MNAYAARADVREASMAAFDLAWKCVADAGYRIAGVNAPPADDSRPMVAAERNPTVQLEEHDAEWAAYEAATVRCRVPVAGG